MGEWELYTLKLKRQVPAEVGDLSYPYEEDEYDKRVKEVHASGEFQIS